MDEFLNFICQVVSLFVPGTDKKEKEQEENK